MFIYPHCHGPMPMVVFLEFTMVAAASEFVGSAAAIATNAAKAMMTFIWKKIRDDLRKRNVCNGSCFQTDDVCWNSLPIYSCIFNVQTNLNQLAFCHLNKKKKKCIFIAIIKILANDYRTAPHHVECIQNLNTKR